MVVAWIFIFCVLGGAGSALLAGSLFVFGRRFSPRMQTSILSYATGTLLGAALLGMIPHALSTAPTDSVLTTVLAGVFGFFVLEKLLVWRHCHVQGCVGHAQSGILILVGDAVHNSIDGIAIAIAFLHSIPLGIATGIAVIAHEIPQEIGDIMILISGGFSRMRSIILNTLASLTTLLGAGGVIVFGPSLNACMPYMFAISAASFLYIALADLAPDHRSRPHPVDTLLQCVGILLGIATIAAVQSLSHG